MQHSKKKIPKYKIPKCNIPNCNIQKCSIPNKNIPKYNTLIRNEGYPLKSTYKIFSKKVNEYETISNLIKMDKNDILIEGEIWIEVEENWFLDDKKDEKFKKILQPKINRLSQ